jgi:hypothetical protein
MLGEAQICKLITDRSLSLGTIQGKLFFFDCPSPGKALQW